MYIFNIYKYILNIRIKIHINLGIEFYSVNFYSQIIEKVSTLNLKKIEIISFDT